MHLGTLLGKPSYLDAQRLVPKPTPKARRDVNIPHNNDYIAPRDCVKVMVVKYRPLVAWAELGA